MCTTDRPAKARTDGTDMLAVACGRQKRVMTRPTFSSQGVGMYAEITYMIAVQHAQLYSLTDGKLVKISTA